MYLRSQVRKGSLPQLLFFVFLTLITSCTLNRTKIQPAPTPTAATSPSTARLPAPVGFVNDFANVIEADQETRLEALLTNLRDKSKIEFAVVTTESTNGETLFDYSLGVAREWGVGPKGAEGGGLLLMVAVKDRQWHLQVSRALEKDLPDEVCKELGDQSVPLYRSGDYAGGIEKYVRAIIDRLKRVRSLAQDSTLILPNL